MSWLDIFAEIRSTDWSEASGEQRRAKAREVITITAYGSAAAAVVPVPFVDLALLLPFHSAMVMTVGHVYGRPVTETEAKRVLLELGAVAGVTVGARAAISALKKVLLPGIGGFLAAPASFAVTYGFGWAAIEYFENPELSREELKKVFKDAVQDAGKSFSKETLERFRKGETEAGVEDVRQQTPDPEDEAASAEAKSSEETPPGVVKGAPLGEAAEDQSSEPDQTPPETSGEAGDERPGLRPKKRTL